MPIATDCHENPRPEEEIADDLKIHEKMYKIATAKYNPFAVGGSENIKDKWIMAPRYRFLGNGNGTKKKKKKKKKDEKPKKKNYNG